MSKRVSRRKLLAAVGGTSVASIAGCVGSLSSSRDVQRAHLPDSVPEDETLHWPTFRNDARNTGSVDRTLGGTSPTEDWRYSTGSPVWGSPVTFNSTVYFASYDKRIHAVDAVTGDRKWQFEMGNVSDSTPGIHKGILVVGSHDQHVYGLNAQTGDQIWKYDAGGIARSSPKFAGGTAYIGTHCQKFACSSYLEEGAKKTGSMVALDVETGEEQWRFETGAGVATTPVVHDEKVVFGSTDKTVYAVGRESGDELWSYDVGAWVWSSPVIVDDTYYLGDMKGVLHAVDAADGSKRWTADTDSKYFTSSIGTNGESLFIGGLRFKGKEAPSKYGGVLSYSLDGDHEWGTMISGLEIGGSPLVSANHLFIGTHRNAANVDGTHMACLTHGGEIKWRIPVKNGIGSSPAIYDRTLYAGTMNGDLLSLSVPE